MTGEGIAFLKSVNIYASQNGFIDEKLYDSLLEGYSLLSESEQDECISILVDAFGGAKRELLSLLTIFTPVTKSYHLYYKLVDLVSDEEFSIEELYGFMLQLNRALFTKHGNVYKPLHKFYYYFLDRCTKELGIQWSYKKYAERNHKRIVIATTQILSEYHSPTQVLVNQCRYYAKLGYTVTVLVINPGKFEIDDKIWLSPKVKMNNLFSETGRFEIEIMNEPIAGYNIMLSERSFLDDVKLAIALLRSINPDFIVNMGSLIVPTDLMACENTLISCPIIDCVPVTRAKFIMLWHSLDLEELYLNPNKDVRLVECKYTHILKPTSVGNEQQVDMVVAQDRFRVIIVGNRLDVEISDTFLNSLFDLTLEIEDILFVIVGECEELKSKVKSRNYEDFFLFVGFVNNLDGVMEACDIFLNPPRTGGGFSAVIALQKNVPIVTLSGGDVGDWVGDDFICSDVKDMMSNIVLYRKDSDYLNRQKEKCQHRYEECCPSEIVSTEHFRKFCDEIIGYIKIDENT